MMKFLALWFLATAAWSLELTQDNWDEETKGKTLFIKYMAPWCGQCKKLAPVWDRLMKVYTKSTTSIVATVDCEGAGKELCEEQEVDGYPTLKYGDASEMEVYNGDRDFPAMLEFAKQTLKPLCVPSQLDQCDDDQKALIKELQSLSGQELQNQVEAEEKKIKEVEDEFDEEVKKLDTEMDKEEKARESTVRLVKMAGVNLMKAIVAQKEKGDIAGGDHPKGHEEL